MRFSPLLLVCLVLSSFVSFPSLFADDFSDLEETRVKVYGSEKDKNTVWMHFLSSGRIGRETILPTTTFISSGLQIRRIIPSSKKRSFFLFFKTIESKLDPRVSKNYFILYNYDVDREGNRTESFFPFLFFWQFKNNSSYLGVLPFFYTSRDEFETNVRSTFVLPGYYQQKPRTEN